MPTYTFECLEHRVETDFVLRMMEVGNFRPKCATCGKAMQRVYKQPQVIDDSLPGGVTEKRLVAWLDPSGDPRKAPVVTSKSGRKRLLAEINASPHVEKRTKGGKFEMY